MVEFAGTLLGFDDYVSVYTRVAPAPFLAHQELLDMVLEDVTELYAPRSYIALPPSKIITVVASDYTGSQTKLPKILLNGNNICMVRLVELYYCKWKLYRTNARHS